MWKEATEEQYDYGLGVLPPAYMDGDGFLVGEPYDHRTCRITKVIRPTFAAFIRYNGKFYASKEALTLPEYKAKTLPI